MSQRISFGYGILAGIALACIIVIPLLYNGSSNSSGSEVAGDDASLISRFPIIRDIINREEKEKQALNQIRAEYNSLKQEYIKASDSLLKSADSLHNKSPPNLPAITKLSQEEKEEIENTRKKLPDYGGKGEQLHLGGFTANDTDGQSPALWEWMLKVLTVKSFLDVGCGRGISTKFFLDHGADVLCVEGSHDGVSQSLLPKDRIVEHDYYRGPWWPEKTYDVAWSVEFLEHIGRHKAENYLATFKKAALLFVTYSAWGGWHHVEVHPNGQYWIYRLQAQGFIYLPELTNKVRKISKESRGDGFRAQHLWLHLMVFVNPQVASLPQHAHLYGGPGCYGRQKLENCKGADELPVEYRPVWSKKSKYDHVDDEMKGMSVDFIDENAARKSKGKGPMTIRRR